MTSIKYLCYIFLIIVYNNYYFIQSLTPKHKFLLHNKNIYIELKKNIKMEKNLPIILNGEKTPLKKDFCKIFCNVNNISFQEYTFDEFINQINKLDKENNVIYINDFMINHGRIFNSYEIDILLSLSKMKSLIIFQVDNLEKISFKNNKIINYCKILNFTNLNKLEIQNFIYNSINYYSYSKELFLLNWTFYDIDKIDTESILILLNEVNNMILTYKISINKIHKDMNEMIYTFIFN